MQLRTQNSICVSAPRPRPRPPRPRIASHRIASHQFYTRDYQLSQLIHLTIYIWPKRIDSPLALPTPSSLAVQLPPSSSFTMASPDHDPLLLLRTAISSSQPFVPSSSADTSAVHDVPLAQATHLQFTSQDIGLSLDAPTRFISSDRPVDLRSIYFAWLNRELAIPEYNAAATMLNDQLAAAGSAGRVQNLGFIERLDLITWLEGASEESEYIKPVVGEADATSAAATETSKPGAAAAAARARSGKGLLDPRLASVYDGERKMGDRNTILRGVKPTDFSHVRKLAAPFIKKKSHALPGPGPTSSLSLNQKAPTRRPDPIILLSPSASSLLRMTNARSFLEDGMYVPADASGSTASMLHVQRLMRAIDPNRPMRFILVEGSEQFKPEYWNRVVAVFTTGQTWQFKNYKWSSPNELFKHTLGVYVGWRGDQVPDSIRNWGHKVLSTGVDRWRGGSGGGGVADASRFRDKEVVEQIWKAVEMNMRTKGWRIDAAPVSI
ncbi:related to DNA-directed RNA polymerase II accessory protein [Claviceps purpurea 20.1]|uniref:Related to DNA-directed RNA polymerase II accessory protein n=1 Tax=Claviceps purpurea (strain 20.1) TaxID=1111077 RepID=M1W3H1_CLAP2|nr:related to DNA-directed RNA polymerase II accessory protein [Claviceps purpurea 20.1]